MMTNYEEALLPLSSKRRSYDDLSRFVGSRAGEIPNYTMLLGAGCSVSSNIRSAAELTKVWRQEISKRLCPDIADDPDAVRDYLSKNQASWFNPSREYSSLFEKSFDLPRQRRMFVEQEVSGKSPSLGYSYLIKLVEHGFLNTVFTTNFDDLVNEAFFQFSGTRPIVCAHDSSAASLAVTSKRPKIIKLHGDYLFDDIKATVRETESLEENTRKKFIEFGRDFGLIVVGYGGGDRSVMDVLQYLLRSDDYFKHGVYWCVRKGEHLSDDLIKLLWRDRVYFVEIEGFDEVMAELHNDVVGDSLPIDTSIINDKPQTIIREFCENSFLKSSKSAVITRDLARLKQQMDHEQLLNVFRDFRKKARDDEKDGEQEDALQDRDFAAVLRIKETLASGGLGEAREKIKEELLNTTSKRFIDELREMRIRLEELAGDPSAAIAVFDEMISDDPFESDNYIRKSQFYVDLGRRWELLELAAAQEPSNFRIYNSMIHCLVKQVDDGIKTSAEALVMIENAFAKSRAFEPGGRNGVWATMADVYSEANLPKDEQRRRLSSLLSSCSAFGSRYAASFDIRLKLIKTFPADHYISVEADELLADLLSASQTSPKAEHPEFVWLHLSTLQALERVSELDRRLNEISGDPVLSTTVEFFRFKADFSLNVNGDLSGATSFIQKAVKLRSRPVDILRLSNLYKWDSNSSGIASLLIEHGMRLKPADLLQVKKDECAARGDLDGELALVRSGHNAEKPNLEMRIEEVHLLLQRERWAEAASIAKEELEARNWSKFECGVMIINFELAMLRDGKSMQKGRLKELSDASSDKHVRLGAYYLLGDMDKAKDAAKSLYKSSKSSRFVFSTWAIFADERGANFLKAALQ